MRSLALSLVTVVAVLLAGCSTPPPPSASTPTPTPTVAAEPTTLDELGEAVVAAGLADMANLYLVGGNSGAVTIQLFWNDSTSPSEQLAAFAEVNTRVDYVVEDRPEGTHIGLLAERDDGEQSAVVSTYDPGEDILRDMLETAVNSSCPTASLDRGDFGKGVMTKVTLGCTVDAADAVGLAGRYDDVTTHQIPGVGLTEWEVSLTDRPTTDANLRLDAGPIEGRQQLFVDVMRMAVAEGVDHITLIDSGESIDFIGFTDAEQTGLCATMVDRIHAAGVERASVSLQLRDAKPEAWGCRVVPS